MSIKTRKTKTGFIFDYTYENGLQDGIYVKDPYVYDHKLWINIANGVIGSTVANIKCILIDNVKYIVIDNIPYVCSLPNPLIKYENIREALIEASALVFCYQTEKKFR